MIRTSSYPAGTPPKLRAGIIPTRARPQLALAIDLNLTKCALNYERTTQVSRYRTAMEIGLIGSREDAHSYKERGHPHPALL
jgi:hypothetical protein